MRLRNIFTQSDTFYDIYVDGKYTLYHKEWSKVFTYVKDNNYKHNIKILKKQKGKILKTLYYPKGTYKKKKTKRTYKDTHIFRTRYGVHPDTFDYTQDDFF